MPLDCKSFMSNCPVSAAVDMAPHDAGIPTGVKRAPEIWVLRRPVSPVQRCTTRFQARYPPRNLLNAHGRHGTFGFQCRPTLNSTFPIIPNTSACAAA